MFVFFSISILAFLNETNSSNFLKYLNYYCIIPTQLSISIYSSLSPIENKNHSYSYINSEQQITSFLALSRMSTWIFHPDKYDSTMKTIENLFSHIPINFTIRPNRLAFYYALLNEHIPIIYYCLANY